MATKKVNLTGLRGNYKNDYLIGEVVFRKYQKQWHIYTSCKNVPWGVSPAKDRVTMAPNSLPYVKEHDDLRDALMKAGKPLTTINDKTDNVRWGLSDIVIEYDTETGLIVGHKLTVASPDDIKTHREVVKARKEHYNKMPSFATFLANANDN